MRTFFKPQSHIHIKLILIKCKFIHSVSGSASERLPDDIMIQLSVDTKFTVQNNLNTIVHL